MNHRSQNALSEPYQKTDKLYQISIPRPYQVQTIIA